MDAAPLSQRELLTLTVAITAIVILVCVVGFALFVRWGLREQEKSRREVETARIKAEWPDRSDRSDRSD
jgi:multisubunit Na+/H+ antiporter MnhC subunit